MAKSMEATRRLESRRVREHQSKPMALRQFLKITQEAFARLIGVSLRSVTRWENGDVQPDSEKRKKLDYLLTISRRLEESMDREHITDWLTTPNPVFLNKPPMDLVQSEYSRHVLEQELDRAEWGIPG
ncbi:MAG TPA: helix-turn-helix domain-containing protein [Myxococcota bacterium]|nr:helix-turn-helix domain-containing protein [Myxococcota bacterium]